MADKDDRGFAKSELQMFNPAAVNFQLKANLVERDPAPNGYQLVDPDRSGKKTQMDLVELAAVVQKADEFTRATAGSKLAIIAEQVRFLQEQARKVLEDARLNALLHQTSCNFKKVPGHVYYVYKQRKQPDKEFISMIAPQEWGASCPEFVAAYRLEHDMSWTQEVDWEKRRQEQQMVDSLLNMATSSSSSNTSITFSFLPSQYQANLALAHPEPSSDVDKQ